MLLLPDLLIRSTVRDGDQGAQSEPRPDLTGGFLQAFRQAGAPAEARVSPDDLEPMVQTTPSSEPMSETGAARDKEPAEFEIDVSVDATVPVQALPEEVGAVPVSSRIETAFAEPVGRPKMRDLTGGSAEIRPRTPDPAPKTQPLPAGPVEFTSSLNLPARPEAGIGAKQPVADGREAPATEVRIIRIDGVAVEMRAPAPDVATEGQIVKTETPSPVSRHELAVDRRADTPVFEFEVPRVREPRQASPGLAPIADMSATAIPVKPLAGTAFVPLKAATEPEPLKVMPEIEILADVAVGREPVRHAAPDVARAAPSVHSSSAGPILVAQVAEAARGLGDGPVRISLAPEELGSVRLTLSVTETGITVHVAAERDETLQLLRRHAGMLSDSMSDAGFGETSFTFEQDRGSAGREQPGTGHETGLQGEPERPRADVITVVPDRLDLRL
ncbi:flagellar hook-length control protein FliK [Tranquillimonas rosea]|uniref:flagellar hook-length control protein FliK n=1 Tax=Tranquillimonas rosea TaxID=641238 RepID=UPI003BAC55D2